MSHVRYAAPRRTTGRRRCPMKKLIILLILVAFGVAVTRRLREA
jgi:hypothetical protein